MAKIVDIRDRRRPPGDPVITRRPWEFRRANWGGMPFIQVLRPHAKAIERRRGGSSAFDPLVPHVKLRGGMATTIQAAFTYRNNEALMRDVYYLAGLIDCMTSRVSPLLRTGGIQQLYDKIMTMKGLLHTPWYGCMDRVLLPIERRLFSDRTYREALAHAGSLKDLYRAIREGTDTMFGILSREYVFYAPGKGESDGKGVT